MPFSRPLLAAAALVAPAALGAQSAAYRRTVHDTVRFREVTTTQAVIRTPGGATPLTSTQSALVAVAYLPNDSARAWYEELMLEASGSHVTEHPTTTAALRKPFTLRLDSRGRAETLQAPTFPAALNRIADLRHQFDDFFLRLPAAPLRRGLAWSDTLSRADSTPGGGYSRHQAIARYRVERDTVVQGTPALVVSMEQDVKLVTGGPIEGQPVSAESVLEGPDRGLFVFAASEGRLLGRTHSGDLKGNVTLKGGPQPVVVPQSFTYKSTLEPATVSAAALSLGETMRRFAIPPTTLGASCSGLTGDGQPLLLSPTQASKWADIYGVLVGWFGREEMPEPDDVQWMSSANYATGGRGRPAIVAVQFSDSAKATAAERLLARRAAARREWSIARRGAVVTMVNAPAALPTACRGELTGRVARELGR